MNEIGVVRKVDRLGRICLPVEMRRSLHVREGDAVQISYGNGVISIQKYNAVENLDRLLSGTAMSIQQADALPPDIIQELLVKLDEMRSVVKNGTKAFAKEGESSLCNNTENSLARDPKKAYEIFQLQWMLDHGYSIRDLIDQLEVMAEEDENKSGVRTDLQSLLQDWEYGFGFDGSIWPCYQEFLDTDYPAMLQANQE